MSAEKTLLIFATACGSAFAARPNDYESALEMDSEAVDGVDDRHVVPQNASEWHLAGYSEEDAHCSSKTWASLYLGKVDWSEPWKFQKPSDANREKYYSRADTMQRESFYSKMLQCKGGLYMWGFGSLLNAFTIPKIPTDVHPYTIAGLERGWAANGPANYEIMALGVEPNLQKQVTGGFSSHANYIDAGKAEQDRCLMKQAWSEAVWCREVTEAHLKMEFIYVPSELQGLMGDQEFFHYGKNPPPSDTMRDACIYTNVPSNPLVPPTAPYRLLQTYIDTVMIGALLLGGDDFVERTILTTGFWSNEYWQNDRESPYYVRSPSDIFKNYNGENHPKTPVNVDGSRYRLTFKQCIEDMSAKHGEVEALFICQVMAVCMEDAIKASFAQVALISCSSTDNNAMHAEWLQRVEDYVDHKLGQAKLTYFTLDRNVYMGKETDDLPFEQWEPQTSGTLLSLRKDYDSWKRLCAQDGTPLWRGDISVDFTTTNCGDQTIQGESYKTQRGLG